MRKKKPTKEKRRKKEKDRINSLTNWKLNKFIKIK